MHHNNGKFSIQYITAVPLTNIRHTGLDPVSSKPLKNQDSGSAKSAVRNDGTLF
jgi:2-methylcitrate dehydratase PrpD